MYFLTQRRSSGGCWPFRSQSAAAGYAGVATEAELYEGGPHIGDVPYNQEQYDAAPSSSRHTLAETHTLGEDEDEEDEWREAKQAGFREHT